MTIQPCEQSRHVIGFLMGSAVVRVLLPVSDTLITIHIQTIYTLAATVEVRIPVLWCPLSCTIFHCLVRLEEMSVHEDVVGKSEIHVVAIIHFAIDSGKQLRGVLYEVWVILGSIAAGEFSRLIVIPRHTVCNVKMNLALYVVVSHHNIGLARVEWCNGLLCRLGVFFYLKEREVLSPIEVERCQCLLCGAVVCQRCEEELGGHLPCIIL